MDQSGGHSDASLWILVLGTMKKKANERETPWLPIFVISRLREKKWNIKTETGTE